MLALYTVCAAVLVSVISSAIFTDGILREHYLSVFGLCVSFFLAFCIITLSRYCKLRKKTNAGLDAVETPYDSELESDHEQGIAENPPDLSWQKHFSDFCKRRPIYGIAVVTCLILSMISLYLFRFFDTAEDLRIGSDPWSAEVLLLSTAAAVLAVVYVVAHHEKYEPKSKTSAYKPFDENVEIPMKVYIPKLVAVIRTGQLYILEGLFIQFFLIITLVIVCNCSEQDVTEKGSKARHTFLICAITCANFLLLFCLIERFSCAHELTKDYLLGIFEKNWQRNLKAFEHILPKIEVSSLEDLRLAVLEKMNNAHLTNREKKIIDYIKRPLWESKRAIVDTPAEVRQQENLAPRWQNQFPNRAPEDATPPRQQNPPLEPSDGPSMPRTSPPLTRSRARRRL